MDKYTPPLGIEDPDAPTVCSGCDETLEDDDARWTCPRCGRVFCAFCLEGEDAPKDKECPVCGTPITDEED